MNFKEMMKYYKEGSLSAQETKKVEEELEKYIEITQYYAEQEEIEEIPIISDDDEILRKIKRSAKKNTRRILSAAVALSVVLAMFASNLYTDILRPWVSKQFFYDPLACTLDQQINDLTLKASALKELFFPGSAVAFVGAELSGIGQYTLTLSEVDTMHPTDERKTYEGVVDRGEIFLGHDFMENHPIGSPVDAFVSEKEWQALQKVLSGQKSSRIEELSNLPNYLFLQSWVTFTEDLSLEQIDRLIKRHPNIDFIYVAVRNRAPGESDTQPHFMSIGFNPQAYRFQLQSGSVKLHEQYPFLIFRRHDTHVDFAKKMQQHFTSLLRYCIDTADRENLRLHDAIFSDKNYFQKTLDYVEHHGIHSYGIAVQGRPEDLVKLLKEEKAALLSIHDAKLQLQGM